jgi:S-formylglutathione hydrolase FrmB
MTKPNGATKCYAANSSIFSATIPSGGTEDIFALANEYSTGQRSPLPALRFDCGTEDFLIENNRHLHAHLQKLGVAHQYEEHAGAHNWEYWDEHIPQTIEFFAHQLGIKR